MASDINKNDPHYKGDFGSIYEVNHKFPSGGVAGDFVVIDGWAHYWNADRATWCVNAERDAYWDELITNISELFKKFKGGTYMGLATVDTVPDKAETNMFYFAKTAGTYINFGKLEVPSGISVLVTNDGKTWTLFNLLRIVSYLGTSTTDVVSQKGVSDAISKMSDGINEILVKKFNELSDENKAQDRVINSKANKTDVDNALSKKFDKSDVVQELGDSDDKVISQKAISNNLNALLQGVNTKVFTKSEKANHVVRQLYIDFSECEDGITSSDVLTISIFNNYNHVKGISLYKNGNLLTSFTSPLSYFSIKDIKTHIYINAVLNYDNLVEGSYISDVELTNEAINGINDERGSVITEKLADEVVTTPKLADESVTDEKIAGGAITSDKIQYDAVRNEHIDDDAITTDKIFNGAVTKEKLADDVFESLYNFPSKRFLPLTGGKLSGPLEVVEKGEESRDHSIITQNGMYSSQYVRYGGNSEELLAGDGSVAIPISIEEIDSSFT